MCFPIRHGKRLGETLKLPKLESPGSFKVSASVSEAATSRLGFVSDFKRLGLVSVPETWVSGLVSAQKVSYTSLLSSPRTSHRREATRMQHVWKSVCRVQPSDHPHASWYGWDALQMRPVHVIYSPVNRAICSTTDAAFTTVWTNPQISNHFLRPKPIPALPLAVWLWRKSKDGAS